MQNHFISLLIPLILCYSACTSNNKDGSKPITSVGNVQTVGIVNPNFTNFSGSAAIVGKAYPFRRVELHAMESGFIKNLYVDIGDKVKKGQLIAKLENPELEGLHLQAAAEVQGAEAVLKQRQAELKKWESLKVAKESIYQRLNKTYQKAPNLILVSDVENARSDFDEAIAGEFTTLANISGAQSQIESSKANLTAFKARTQMLSITAPFPGVIAKRNFDIGATIQSALNESDAVPIVELQQTDRIRLTIQVPESDVDFVDIGSVVFVHFPKTPTSDTKASIDRTSRVLDMKSGTMRAEIDLQNEEGHIKPGMYAKVEIQIASRNDVLSLPQSAKFMKDDIPYVLTVVDEVVVEKQIQEGLSNADYFEILNNDFTQDTQVIVQGKSLVKHGQIIKSTKIE